MASICPGRFSLQALDDETAALIVELQIADVDDLWSFGKGKSSSDVPTDAEIAILLQKQDFLDALLFVSDRRMTRSIASAVHTDGDIVTEAATAEEGAARDRDLAHGLNGSSPETIPVAGQFQNMGNAILAKLAGMYVSDTIGQGLLAPRDEIDVSGSSALASSSRAQGAQRRATHLRCEACQDDKPYFDVIETPCNHGYCRDCLHELFDASLTDESLFPPHCCRQNITIESVGIFLTRDLTHRFEQRKVELSTPNRTYCSMVTCSTFIRPSSISVDMGVCADCGTETCVVCKGAAHAGDCPHDIALQQLYDVADENNWQRCYSCRRLVELDIGCNHMM